jgi:hypothetical protein
MLKKNYFQVRMQTTEHNTYVLVCWCFGIIVKPWSKTVSARCTVYSSLEVITGNNGKILDAIGSQKLPAWPQ